MNKVTITVNKANVYDEVAKTTAYVGAKKLSQDGSPDSLAYSRVFTKDDDRIMLERFWLEAANKAADLIKPFLKDMSSLNITHGVRLADNFTATLIMSDRFDTNLTQAIQADLYSFFVSFILASWMALSDTKEAEAYSEDAAAALAGAKAKLYYKMPPKRQKPQ